MCNLTSCPINNSQKKHDRGGKKDTLYLRLECGQHGATLLTQVYMSALIRRVFTLIRACSKGREGFPSLLCEGKRRHQCWRSVKKGAACVQFSLLILKEKMSWVHSSHERRSHTFHGPQESDDSTTDIPTAPKFLQQGSASCV